MAKKGSTKNGKASATKKKRARQKQVMIKGTEPPSIPAIDKAASAYVSVRDERMELTEEEVEHRDRLAELMREHNLDKYEFDNLVVTRRSSNNETVKVKRKPEPENQEA